MSSEESSFRDMYLYPQKQSHNWRRKQAQSRSRVAKSNEAGKTYKQSFYEVVQKAKHVAMFTQTIKHKISEKRTLNQHTLKPQQLQFLDNNPRQQHSKVYFEHNSKIVLSVELLFVVTIFLFLWNNTYELVFQETIQNYLIEFITLLVYSLHIIFFPLTEYTNQKLELINDRNQIFSIYVSEKLTKDAIFMIALLVQISPLDNIPNFEWVFIFTRLVSLISYAEVGGVCSKIQDLFSVSIQAEMTIAILKLFFKVVLFLHILSVALNLLASVEQEFGVEHIWILDNNLQAETSFDKYIIAWYWAATILSTVGFGEITPKNNYERFFVSIIQVFCCMIIGYFVNVIGDLIKLRGESDEKYERQIRSLHRCLKSLSITPELKHKIRTHYFNKHFISKTHNPKQQKQMLQQLTPNLQKSILQQNNIIVLKKSSIFQRMAEEALMDLTLIMKKVILAPENVLYSRSSTEKKLWIIQNGMVEEFTNNFESSALRKRIFTYNQQDSLVGWANFLMQAAYKTLAKAKTFTIAYELQWQKLESCLKEHPHSYRRLLHLKHETLEKNRLLINKCISCDRFTHNAINCPRIHFIRRDIATLARHHKNLHSFQQKQRKKLKYKRQAIKFTWKTRFGNGGLEKEGNLLMNNDSPRVSNGNNIQNLFKNVLFRQSAINFQKRKVSILPQKRQNKAELMGSRESQSNNRESWQKSMNSCDEILQGQQPPIYDKVFFNRDSNGYMPSNDIENVLLLYSKRLVIRH